MKIITSLMFVKEIYLKMFVMTLWHGITFPCVK